MRPQSLPMVSAKAGAPVSRLGRPGAGVLGRYHRADLGNWKAEGATLERCSADLDRRRAVARAAEWAAPECASARVVREESQGAGQGPEPVTLQNGGHFANI